ncbi:Hypothetical predicted protein [Lecanosticta acicola]|uniref:Uncharacterized protein n=1 Tax=Lecanosticta acicola TaxID=111012 RepID=A0AAI8Z6C1_9PEZI|nr:Hypothetical predicted protein [Lecanosticta acicola]
MAWPGDLAGTLGSNTATSDEVLGHSSNSLQHHRVEQSSALRLSSAPSSLPHGHPSKDASMVQTRSRSRYASAFTSPPAPRTPLNGVSDRSSGEQEPAGRCKIEGVRRRGHLTPAADYQPLRKTSDDQRRHARKAGVNANGHTVRSRRHVVESREDIDDRSSDLMTNECKLEQSEPDSIEPTDEGSAAGALRESTKSSATLEQNPGVARSEGMVSLSRKSASSGQECRRNRRAHGEAEPPTSLLDCVVDLPWYIKAAVAVVLVGLTVVGILELTGQPDVSSGTTSNRTKSTPAPASREVLKLQHATNETCQAVSPLLSPSPWDDMSRSPAELLQPVLDLLIPHTALEQMTFADLCHSPTVRTSLRAPSATTALHIVPALDRAAMLLRSNAARLQLAATDMEPASQSEPANRRVWEPPSIAIKKRAEAFGRLADALESLRRVVVDTSLL